MTLDGLLRLLDQDELRRGDQFERLCRWYLLSSPEYRSFVRRVWLWDEWPGRFGSDTGIDLVAETAGGELIAVQAKAYAPDYWIRKSDVDSFLAASARKEFVYRLLIASTDHLGSRARTTIAAQEKPVWLRLRSQLEGEPLEWPSSPDLLSPAKPRRKEPRYHQREAVSDCVQGLSTDDRGQLLMACGTGKTLVGIEIAQAMKARRVLVLVPTLSLLAQVLVEWTAQVELAFLAVCSDETVAGDDPDMRISDVGVPVTTNPLDVRRFLSRRGDELRVVFATYQSSPRIAEAQSGRTPAFDLVIADEAHRCAGPEAGAFTTVLDGSKIKGRKRLFMTATPRIFTGRVRREAAAADWEVASMDDEERFGAVLHRLSFSDAIRRDLLSDYRVVVVGVTDNDAYETAERARLLHLEAGHVTDARTLGRTLGLLRTLASLDLHRVVSFHTRVASAREFAGSLHRVLSLIPEATTWTWDLWAAHVSGKMPSSERKALLHRLGDTRDPDRGVLANAKCLTEGVDVPTLDAVCFMDPRRSQIDVVQAVGRAIRKAEDKTVGTIVVPVFVREGGDAEAELAGREFARVWEVVRALRDHDDALAEEIDELRRELGRSGSVGLRPAKIILDVPTRLSSSFAEAFDAKLVERASSNWEFWFGLLENYVSREGTARVPQGQREQGHALGAWVNTQRSLFRRGDLSDERAHRLDGIRGWTWDPHDESWEEGYAFLLRYVERVGNARIPIAHREDGFRLGQWVNVQRTNYGRGELESERIARLNELRDRGWIWKHAEERWEVGYEHLVRYTAAHGLAAPPAGAVEAGFPVAKWATHQRIAHRNGRLSPDQALRLTELPGWTWEPQRDRWEAAYRLLIAFVDREGHARVPSGHVEQGFALGRWVMRQRQNHKTGRLSTDRAQRLDALEIKGWAWNTRDDAWNAGYECLLGYVERTGSAIVPHAHRENGFGLGGWVNVQRNAYREGHLPPHRCARLEELAARGWTWNTWDAAWLAGLDCLRRYSERTGGARVPSDHVEDGYPLGSWVHTQRTLHRNGRLSGERVALLDAVDGWVWDPHDNAWESAFAILTDYVAREGGAASIKQNHVEAGFRLGTWVGTQRSQYRNGGLSGERVARLEAVAHWSWSALDTRWEAAFETLVRFTEREGHARVPAEHREGSLALGTWAKWQRRMHKQGKLRPDRARRLASLPGWSWQTRRGGACERPE